MNKNPNLALPNSMQHIVETTASSTCARRFSVIIVNYNGGDMLDACLCSVLSLNIPVDQVIVVDNGSRDKSLDLAQRQAPGIMIIRNPCNAGFARAVNQGLEYARGDFVLLLNNDAQLDADALHAFAEVFDQTPNLAIAGGQLLYPDGRAQNAVAAIPSLRGELLPKFLLKWLDPQRYQGKPRVEHPIAVESVIGACLALRRASLEPLGKLDEDYFFFMEETEWCQRARRMGYQVFYVPGARAFHGQGQTVKKFRSFARIEFQRSKLLFFRKTQSRMSYLVVSILLPFKAFINVASNSLVCVLTLCLLSRQRARVSGYWRIFFWHVLGRPQSWGLPNKCLQKK
jgi:N-acetylglucosaminyl-diphospho-decaprenol L-rhamnosyltransferase